MDWRGFEYRSQRLLNGGRTADGELAPKPELHIWGRCSLRQDGKLVHVDRAGHPSVSSFFNTDDTKLEYNASEPVNDRNRWLDQFVHLKLLTRRSGCGDRQGAHTARRAEFRSVETCEVSQRARVY